MLNSTKLKEFAENNFKVDENGGKLSLNVGGAVGKGEIALYEQFLMLAHSFAKACAADT